MNHYVRKAAIRTIIGAARVGGAGSSHAHLVNTRSAISKRCEFSSLTFPDIRRRRYPKRLQHRESHPHASTHYIKNRGVQLIVMLGVCGLQNVFDSIETLAVVHSLSDATLHIAILKS
ncbi:hypothetical protein EVAR_81891_1 [Eumeta japonica]|uniref:Uncharacterized protein n=1 Tax=Eumeta variegata TaxID=151549 RepID=A0A4C1UWW3_EUMVA|nr:hypothetical protein EVAR_81891_1 [Eumeta japonica]